MTEQEQRSIDWKKPATILGLAVLVASASGFVAWSITCPCDRSPGGYLFGDVADAPVADWSFANDVPLCQIQVGRLPYSINLNCMATPAGELYLSCGACTGKRWAGVVLDNGNVRLRLEGTVYPVTATRVRDPEELDRAWEARANKLQAHGEPSNPAPAPGAPRQDSWGSFRLKSR